jgi:hypothetical protein
VRIKLVNLNNTGLPSRTPSSRTLAEPVSALVGSTTNLPVRTPSVDDHYSSHGDGHQGEICVKTGATVPHAEFENHIEQCTLCSNRVELQLDFIETLEAAMYQRFSSPGAPKVKGAMLISSPEMNFAVCGELDF